MTLRLLICVLTFCGLTGCYDNIAAADNTNVITEDEPKAVFPVRATFKNPDKTFEDTLVASVNDINFLITPEGKVLWGQNSDDTVQLSTELIIDKAYLYLEGQFLYIFYTETDHDGATSRFEKINLSSRQKLLKAEIDGFNLGLPYIVNNFAYVTAIGSIGKLNLTTGQYQYQHTDLYDDIKYSFNHFDTIIFNGGQTLFLGYNRNGNRMDTVLVNETTGDITIKK